MDRRTFVKSAGLAAALSLELASAARAGADDEADEDRDGAGTSPSPHITWSIFSRHLQWLTTQAYAAANPNRTGVLIGQAALQMGFAATNLTVRPGGHVEPSNVVTNLPLMLQGIRSTGCICDEITTSIVPSTDPAVDWVSTLFVRQILATAAGNGIKLYRFGADGYNTNVTPPLFGKVMLRQLDALRIQMEVLNRLNQTYGRMRAVYHTFNNDVGTAIWDLMDHVYAGRDTSLLGINYAVGHIVTDGPQSLWSINLRRAMPCLWGTALQDVIWTQNATGQWTSPTVVAGTGMIQWKTFFQLLLQGSYDGPGDLQIEYTINGALGQSVSLNNAFWADNAQFTSGNLTPAIMLATIAHEVAYYKTQAVAVGWTPAQLTPST
jgi:hypothetical protein